MIYTATDVETWYPPSSRYFNLQILNSVTRCFFICWNT